MSSSITCLLNVAIVLIWQDIPKQFGVIMTFAKYLHVQCKYYEHYSTYFALDNKMEGSRRVISKILGQVLGITTGPASNFFEYCVVKV